MGLGALVVLVVEVGSVCGPLGWVVLDGFCFWDIGALIGWWTLLSRIRDLVSAAAACGASGIFHEAEFSSCNNHA